MHGRGLALRPFAPLPTTALKAPGGGSPCVPRRPRERLWGSFLLARGEARWQWTRGTGRGWTMSTGLRLCRVPGSGRLLTSLLDSSFGGWRSCQSFAHRAVMGDEWPVCRKRSLKWKLWKVSAIGVGQVMRGTAIRFLGYKLAWGLWSCFPNQNSELWGWQWEGSLLQNLGPRRPRRACYACGCRREADPGRGGCAALCPGCQVPCELHLFVAVCTGSINKHLPEDTLHQAMTKETCHRSKLPEP